MEVLLGVAFHMIEGCLGGGGRGLGAPGGLEVQSYCNLSPKYPERVGGGMRSNSLRNRRSTTVLCDHQ